MGYYTRVRNMQKAAQQIMAEHDGKFPRDYDAILALPGIGRYTANAVATFAFDGSVPIVEATAYVVRGAVFLAGGRSGTVTRSAIDRIDLASGALAAVGTLPNPVADAGSASIGDTLYLFGGESPGRLRGILAVSAA